MILDSLTHPVVRDLAGVMSAPGLLAPFREEMISDAECAGLLSRYRRDLLALDRDPQPLLDWLGAGTTSHLLGKYFESLLGFWISRLMPTQRMESSIKVLRDKRTLGELDFVFETLEGQVWHWEVSVKFYLCISRAQEAGQRTDQFWGTMTQDRLDKKMAKLFDHQLGMPHTREGQYALLAAGFEAPPQSRLFMKGALFYPLDRDWRTHIFPPEASPTHLRGWWSKDLPETEHWVVLDRRRWLSPFLGTPDFEPIVREKMQAQITAHFAEERIAFMVAGVERSVDGTWREVHRGMVVHPEWPWRVVE